MLERLRICLLAVAMLFCPGFALAKNLVVDRAIFEDPTGAMSLAQVKSAAFKPAPEVIFERFSRSTFWVRLLVDAPAAGGPLAVRIRPTLLDSATLYYAAEAGDPEIALDMSARSAQRDTRIELQPGRHTLYIRAASVGAMLIKAQVVSPDHAIEQDLNEFLELGAVLALYVLLTLVMVALIILRRDALTVFFFVHLFVCLVLYLMVFGFLDNHLLQNWPHIKTASRLTVIVNFMTGSLLMQCFLGYFEMRRLQRLMQFAVAAFVVLMVLFFVGDRSVVMNITTIFGALISFAHLACLFYLCFSLLKKNLLPKKSKYFVSFVVSLLTAVVCRTMLQALSVIEGGAFLLQSPAWRGGLFTLMLFGFLWYQEDLRTRKLVQNQLDIAISEARVKEKNLRMETQSQFMGMLMHELKTPLYIIQVAATSLSRHLTGNNPDTKRLDNIARAADDINFIIDRCVQADRLDQNDLQVQKTPVALKTLLAEVTHIKGQERVTFSGIDQAMVVTDYQFARIILINLVTNALKYSPAGSPIQLTVQETPWMAGQGLTLRISNAVASAGHPDPLKVFTRYYRAEGAKKEVGAGLGLWLAHSLAIKLGHELRCSSDDEYVHFDFSLELS